MTLRCKNCGKFPRFSHNKMYDSIMYSCECEGWHFPVVSLDGEKPDNAGKCAELIALWDLNFGEPKPSDSQVDGSHYKDTKIQPAYFCQVNKLDWCEANVIKYVCRHRKKNGKKDIEKAIHYLNLLLEWYDE